MATLLDLAVKIGLEDEASDKIGGVAKEIADRAGSAIAGAGKVAAGVTAAAGGAAVALGTAALEGYGEFEQLAGGIEKLYGDAAATVQENAQQAYQTAGMSANEYLSNAMSVSAALISSVGGDTEKAAELTDVAMRAISDNVNTFGRDAEAVTAAVIGMSRGNYTMLDNLSLGYHQSAEGMMQLINDSGVLGEQLTDTSQLAEVGFGTMVEALQAVQEQNGIAGTTATEAATTLEGAAGMTQAAWQNLIAEMGKDDGDVGARMQELVDSAVTLLLGAVDASGEQISGGIIGTLGTVFGNLAESLPEQMPLITAAIEQVLPELANLMMNALPPLLEGLTTVAAALATQIGPILSTLLPVILEMAPELVQIAFDLFIGLVEGLNQAAPEISSALFDAIGAIITIILENAPALLLAAGELFVSLVTALTEKREEVMSSLGEMLGQIISDVGANVGALLGEAMNLFGQMLVAAGETVTAIPGKVTEIIGAITGGLAGAVTEVFTGAQVVAGQVVAAISSILTGGDSVGTKIGEVINTIMDAFGPTAVSDLLTKAGEVIAQVPSAIGTAITDVTTKIGEVVTEITSPFDGIDLFSVGASIIQGLIDGIGSLAQGAIDAVGGIIQGIADLLPHSPAKKGPMSGKGWTLYSGQAIMSALAEGIEDTAGDAERATADAVQGVYDATSGTVKVGMAASGSEPILAALNAILAAIPDAVYLDSKALVGNLATEMDYAMGGLI